MCLKLKNSSLVFLLILFPLILIIPAFATTYVFTPDDHSVYLDQRDPGLNYVSKTGLLTVSGQNENTRTVIHFDLGGWTPGTDSIVQAKLYLYHYRGGYYTDSRIINVYPLNTVFSESTATWNSPWTTPGGDYDSTFGTSADVPEAWGNWVFWDVTEIFRNRWNHVISYGFLIKDSAEDTSTTDGPYVRFYSHRCLNDADTSNDYAPYLEVVTSMSSVVNMEEENYPRGFSLMQNFPNPFNGETLLPFDIPRTSNVSLVIYNLLGERVKTLLDESRPAGLNTVVWDGTDQWGRPVSSGIYFYQLSAENCTRAKRLLYLK